MEVDFGTRCHVISIFGTWCHVNTNAHNCPGVAERANVSLVRNSSPSMQVQEESVSAAATIPTLQARKQQLVRDAIWDTAIDLFAQKGFDETTVDDIAHAAGTSRRSFFRYFESKSDLIAQPVVNYVTLVTDTIRSCPPTDSISEVFRHTVLQVAQYSAVQPRARQVMEIAVRFPAAREAQGARLAQIQERIADAFAERCRNSPKERLTANLLAGLTFSLLSATFRSWFDAGHEDITEAVDQVFATLEDLVCGMGVSNEKKHPTRKAAASACGSGKKQHGSSLRK